MGGRKVLVYPMRRDLRVADNPILHHLATDPDHGFTDILPLYVFESHLIEISGFIDVADSESPYPAARSKLAKFWRCGPHRAKFTAQAVWDVKLGLESLGAGLVIRVGKLVDVLEHLLSNFGDEDISISSIWMTEECTTEEIAVQDEVASLCATNNLQFKLWPDEKYLIDDRDTGLETPRDVSNIFTGYRKSQEPLREKPRAVLPRPRFGSLPKFPDPSIVPEQAHPFVTAQSLAELEARLLKPLHHILHNPPPWPEGTETSHPFTGGESHAMDRLKHLMRSSFFWTYQHTRNGLDGVDFSSKLSAYLALGCLTARQMHHELLALEDGTNDEYKDSRGFGRGQTVGTASMRFELLWRDYMRLCALKFGANLFRVEGYHDKEYNKNWLAPLDASGSHVQPTEGIDEFLKRFLEGTTGLGFVDASQRELYNTGYTSNRARQNVASFLTKHLDIDWRYGAEWYESMLVDYDVSSNWGNWQYVAGVGNDPRGDARVFNPVKQSFEYDKEGIFTKRWVPEVRVFESLENVFQAWTATPEALAMAGLTDNIMVTSPLKHVIFNVERRIGQQPSQRNASPDSDTLSAASRDDPPGESQGRGRGGGRSGRSGGGGGRGGRGGRAGGGGGGGGNSNQNNLGGNGALPTGSQDLRGSDRGRGGFTNHALNGGHTASTFNNGRFGNGSRAQSQARGTGRIIRGADGRIHIEPWRADMSTGSSPPTQNRARGNNRANNSSWRGCNRGGSSHSDWRGSGQGQNRPGRQQHNSRARPQNQHQSQPPAQYHNQMSGYPSDGGFNYHNPAGMNPFMQQPMGQAFEAYPSAQNFAMPWGAFGQWPPMGAYMEQQQQQQPVPPQQGQEVQQQPQPPQFWGMSPHNPGPSYAGGQ